MIQDRVVLVGGGLAGLAAAIELVERGLDVTVIEAGDRCGGKLSSCRDEEGDPVEHGIHGWWPNYVNLSELMERVAISPQALQVASGSLGVLPDGSTFAMKPLLIRLPSPTFLMAHFLKSPESTLPPSLRRDPWSCRLSTGARSTLAERMGALSPTVSPA